MAKIAEYLESIFFSKSKRNSRQRLNEGEQQPTGSFLSIAERWEISIKLREPNLHVD